MGNEVITQKQCIAIMITFLIGSSLVLGTGSKANKDSWIAIIIAILISLIVSLIYARLLSLFPQKGLFEILLAVFGKVIGKILMLLFVWFAFHLGALVIRNFTEFIHIVTLPETPQYVLAIFVIVLSIWAVKAGIEVIGRWTAIVLPIVIAAIVTISFLFIPIIEIKNIKPVLCDGIKPVFDTAINVFAFPFAELILFSVIFCNLKSKNSPYKIYLWSLLIGGAIILLVNVRNLLSLGSGNISILYFSSYSSVRLINIGDFLQRIEVSVAVVFMLCGFIKVCICLLVSSKGIARVLNFKNYRQIVAPIGLLMMILSLTMYSNTMEMFEWASHIYKYYAFPFEVILPLFIWISAEIKVKSDKKKFPTT